jgi:hypothetical protein
VDREHRREQRWDRFRRVEMGFDGQAGPMVLQGPVVRVDVAVELVGREPRADALRQDGFGGDDLADPAGEIVDEDLGVDVAVAIPGRSVPGSPTRLNAASE